MIDLPHLPMKNFSIEKVVAYATWLDVVEPRALRTRNIQLHAVVHRPELPSTHNMIQLHGDVLENMHPPGEANQWAREQLRHLVVNAIIREVDRHVGYDYFRGFR